MHKPPEYQYLKCIDHMKKNKLQLHIWKCCAAWQNSHRQQLCSNGKQLSISHTTIFISFPLLFLLAIPVVHNFSIFQNARQYIEFQAPTIRPPNIVKLPPSYQNSHKFWSLPHIHLSATGC